MSRLEAKLDLQLRALRVPAPAREYRFALAEVGTGPGIRKRLKAAGLRDWRFDFAWPAKKFAVEVEGGAWVNGRHTRGQGFVDDCVKYHHAMRLGWTVYRCEGNLINSGEAAALVADILGGDKCH